MGTEFSACLADEIEKEARHLDLSGSEYAPLLFLIARGITSKGRKTPFGNAIANFLAARSLDPDRITCVVDDILKACALHDRGKAHDDLQSSIAGELTVALSDPAGLSNWKKPSVHLSSRPASSLEEDRETIFRDVPPISQLVQRQGRSPRGRVSAFGRYAGLTGGSAEFAEEKRAEIDREDRARR